MIQNVWLIVCTTEEKKINFHRSKAKKKIPKQKKTEQMWGTENTTLLK